MKSKALCINIPEISVAVKCEYFIIG